MLIVATFKHSLNLEIVLKLLEQRGIAKENLLVVPLKKQFQDASADFHQNDHKDRQYDIMFVTITVFMLFGAIYGFALAWGPIIWSLIGIAAGACTGLFIQLIYTKVDRKKSRREDSEVVLMIQCEPPQADFVERLLWKHGTLGVSGVMS